MASLIDDLISYGVPERIAKRVKGRLGYGTEGAVYDIGHEKVLKVNVMANTRRHSVGSLYSKVKGRSWAASMTSHGSLTKRGFWYVAPRLYPIPHRLRSLLDDIGMMTIRYARGSISKSVFEAYVYDRIESMPPGLAKVVRAARRAGYLDLHGKNVMQTKAGVFKLIDVESIHRGR